MASKRKIRRKSCGNKRRYPTDAAARYAVAMMITHDKTRGGVLRAYKCSFCKSFHIGHSGGSVPLTFEKLDQPVHKELHIPLTGEQNSTKAQRKLARGIQRAARRWEERIRAFDENQDMVAPAGVEPAPSD
jgi:hypothetical protein